MKTPTLLLAAGLALSPAAHSENDDAAQRNLDTSLAIFINGYGNDPLPKDPKSFDKLLKTITTEGHFNAILCTYTP